ncbi:hypothetical protein ACMUMQ_10210 [Marinomonas sp. 2405UD66-6]|uniref:hypothetical protein n=1 Tax=Marinomonas sp. 2405UD66-6 TaxID=3391834 RepID=UPI0039C8C565
MGTQKSETLPDVTYWLLLEIMKVNPVVDINAMYKGSLELDFLYQVLTAKANLHWRKTYGVQLPPMIMNSAFFRAMTMVHNRNIEFERSRNSTETEWVKDLLKR